jgi:hypothetical protein
VGIRQESLNFLLGMQSQRKQIAYAPGRLPVLAEMQQPLVFTTNQLTVAKAGKKR